MDTMMMIELFGYLGSVLVLASMTMSSLVRLRVINLMGALVFTIYGLMIHSYPTAILNFVCSIVNIWHLIRMTGTNRSYELVYVRPDDGMLEYFLTVYQDDIRRFFPDFQKNITEYDTAYLVCSDTVPAGVLLGSSDGNGTLDTVLDYTTPAYRDCSVGKFLYDTLPERGILKLKIQVPTAGGHEYYMEKMGFGKEGGVHVRNL